MCLAQIIYTDRVDSRCSSQANSKSSPKPDIAPANIAEYHQGYGCTISIVVVQGVAEEKPRLVLYKGTSNTFFAALKQFSTHHTHTETLIHITHSLSVSKIVKCEFVCVREL